METKAIYNHIKGHGKIFLVPITRIIASVLAHFLQESAMLAGNQGIVPVSAAMLSDASVVEAIYVK